MEASSIKKALQVAVSAAHKGGEALMANLGKLTEIQFKGEINLLTAADRESEEKILWYLT